MAGDQPVGFAHEPFDVAVEAFELADLVGGVGEGSRQAHALRAVGGIDEPFARRGNFGGGAGAIGFDDAERHEGGAGVVGAVFEAGLGAELVFDRLADGGGQRQRKVGMGCGARGVGRNGCGENALAGEDAGVDEGWVGEGREGAEGMRGRVDHVVLGGEGV